MATATRRRETATITVAVTTANTAPVALDDAYSTDEDTLLTVDVASGVLNNDSDPDGDTITAAILQSPANGSVNLSADGSFEYIPDGNANGDDTFTYTLSDGELTAEATVTISVAAVNDAPVAVDETYENDGGHVTRRRYR